MTRGQRGRLIGRAMIAGTCVAIASVAYLYVEMISASSPMVRTPPDLFGLPVADVALMAGLVGAIVGVLWMVRIHRADPEPDQHAWRYRRHDHTRGRSRLAVTAAVMAVIAVLVLVGTVWTSAPGQLGRMLRDLAAGSMVWASLAPALGFIGIVVGTLWVVRIARDDPDADQHAWRYRRRDR